MRLMVRVGGPGAIAMLEAAHPRDGPTEGLAEGTSARDPEVAFDGAGGPHYGRTLGA